jgi:UDP-2,3-diacylglucosamine hydrolase
MSASAESRIEKLGLIAGGGSMPQKLLHACEKRNIDVFVVGFEGQTDKSLIEGRQHMWTRLGAGGQIMDTLRNHNIRDLVFIGSIRRPSLSELKPDMRTAKFFARIGLRALGDDGLLQALRRELEEEGFQIHGIQQFADDLLAGEGTVGRHIPAETDWPDIERGMEILTGTGRFDVGQALIMQEGTVLGIEAAEGTDELIRRCHQYGRKGRKSILVKIAKPGQDRDLDLPTIGPETVKLCSRYGVGGIVIHAGSSLLLDPDEVKRLADETKMFVIGVDPDKALYG